MDTYPKACGSQIKRAWFQKTCIFIGGQAICYIPIQVPLQPNHENPPGEMEMLYAKVVYRTPCSAPLSESACDNPQGALLLLDATGAPVGVLLLSGVFPVWVTESGWKCFRGARRDPGGLLSTSSYIRFKSLLEASRVEGLAFGSRESSRSGSRSWLVGTGMRWRYEGSQTCVCAGSCRSSPSSRLSRLVRVLSRDEVDLRRSRGVASPASAVGDPSVWDISRQSAADSLSSGSSFSMLPDRKLTKGAGSHMSNV